MTRNWLTYFLCGTPLLAAAAALQVVSGCSSDDAASPNGAVSDGGKTDAPQTVTTCPPVVAPTCTAKACTEQNNGNPAICVKGACVPLKTEDCTVVYGPYDDDNAYFFGAVHDLFGGLKSSGTASINAHELALTEINQKGGIRDPDPCKPAHPLVMVGCNESNVNPDGTSYVAPVGADGGATELSRQQRSAEQITGALDLPVWSGGDSSGNSLALQNYAMPRYQKLYITTRSTSPVFEAPTTFNASPNGTRLFWRATGNAKGQTTAMRLVQAQIAEEAKTKFTSSSVKVVLLAKNDAFGQGTADAYETGLQVNGAPAGGASNANASYVRINYRERPDVAGTGTTSATVVQSDAVAAVKAFNPDIIVIIGTDELVNGVAGVTDPRNSGLVKPYEDYLQANAGARKPFYLHAHASLSSAFSSYLNNFANFGSNAAIRKDFLQRTRGTNLSEPTPLAAAFFNRYREVYQTPTESLYGMPESYDATYVIAYLYASVLATRQPVTAEALAKAFPNLVEGATAVDNGPAAFNAALQALTTGAKINYNGAIGALDWNYTTGEAPYNSNVWCAQVNASNGQVFFQQNAGQLWRYATGVLDGAFNCPQN